MLSFKMAMLLYNNVKEKAIKEEVFELLYIFQIHIYPYICEYNIESLDKSSES